MNPRSAEPPLPGVCGFIGGPCELKGSPACEAEPPVACRLRREKIEKEREGK